MAGVQSDIERWLSLKMKDLELVDEVEEYVNNIIGVLSMDCQSVEDKSVIISDLLRMVMNDPSDLVSEIIKKWKEELQNEHLTQEISRYIEIVCSGLRNISEILDSGKSLPTGCKDKLKDFQKQGESEFQDITNKIFKVLQESTGEPGMGKSKTCLGGKCGFLDMEVYMYYYDCVEGHSCCFQDAKVQGDRIICYCNGKLIPRSMDGLEKKNYNYVFFDVSNIVNDAKLPPKQRINFAELRKVFMGNRNITRATAYYSPADPPNSRDFAIMTQLQTQHWIVPPCGRRTSSGKHKAEDTTLVCDATKLLAQNLWPEGTIILLGGDADMLPILRDVKASEFSLEIWSWQKAISPQLREFAKHSQNISINELDLHQSQFVE